MKRIIVVVDDPALKRTLGFLFDPMEYTTVIYTSVISLLENKSDSPDLFILDWQPEGIDGLQICRFLKFNECTRDIPVIILSDSTLIEKKATALGAAIIFKNPLQTDKLKNIVSNFTHPENIH